MVEVRRVLVHGVAGSGKTTLARQLGEATGLPWHSADDEIGWLPGWRQRPVEEQVALADALTSGPAWVLDTAWSSWRHLALARADLVVALDYPRHVSVGRLLRRTAGRVLTRREVCNGNVETLRLVLGRDSVLLWHVRSVGRKRRQVAQMAADPDGPPVLRLTSPRATRRWLEEVRRGTTLGGGTTTGRQG